MPDQTASRGTVQEIPLEAIDIGTAQVRVDLSVGIEDLIRSIRVQGLLQPIIVFRTSGDRYEILAGQRRFLACEKLGFKTIRAVVREGEQFDEMDKVAISLTENVVREDNRQKELIDACTKLFKRYGSIKMVAEEVGLNPQRVSKYVKYDQLVPDLKQLVDNAKLDIGVALQAQTAAQSEDGTVDSEAAVKFASELAPMSNLQRKQFVKVVQDDPQGSIEERIEHGRKQPVLKQIIVTLESSLHKGLQRFAQDESLSQDEAALVLIEDGLLRRGFKDEGDD